MKIRKVFSAVVLLFTAFSLHAQTGAGNLIIGGTTGFNYSKTGDVKETRVNVNPWVYYFIIDNLAAGAGVNVNFSTTETGGAKVNTNDIGLKPMVRYYLPGEGMARFFAQAFFLWSTQKFGEGDPQSGIGFGAGIGADIFLNDHVALEALIGYDNFKYQEATDGTGTIGLNIGVAAFIGGE